MLANNEGDNKASPDCPRRDDSEHYCPPSPLDEREGGRESKDELLFAPAAIIGFDDYLPCFIKV